MASPVEVWEQFFVLGPLRVLFIWDFYSTDLLQQLRIWDLGANSSMLIKVCTVIKHWC